MQLYAANDPYLQIYGLSHNLQHDVNTYLSGINVKDKFNTIDEHYQHQIENNIRTILRISGYYSPIINFKNIVNNHHYILKIYIKCGKPIKIAGINIILHGEAKKDNDYLKWINNKQPALGAILNHNDYDTFKDGLFNLALRKGYFDAFFNKHKLYVIPSLYKAYWSIEFNSGPRYTFGLVNFHGIHNHNKYLHNLVKISKGTPYNSELLAELNHRLTMINWFNSVVIEPDFNIGKINKILPLNITVIPKKNNNVKIGIGYSTDIGPRIKFIWSKPWLYTTNHSLLTNISLFKNQQTLDLNYKIPLLKNPLEQYYLLRTRIKHEYINNIRSYSTILHIARYWNLSSGWQKTINLRWSLENFTQANIAHTTKLIYPGISINRIRQRGGVMPTWGDSQHYSVDISNVFYGSDINFIIWQAYNIWIRSLINKHRFVIRGNLGWIQTNDYQHIPPSLCFFAGGDHSIRGYRYKSIAPHNHDGKLIGATKLIVGSLEYQYNIIGKWWSSIFMDSGEAVQNIKDNHFKTGIGIGICWESLIGPIKLDIATPIKNHNKHNIQFYIGLGPEL